MNYLDCCKEAHYFPEFFVPKRNEGILDIQNGDFQRKVITKLEAQIDRIKG